MVEFTEAPDGWELLGVPVEQGGITVENGAGLSTEERALLMQYGALFGKSAARSVAQTLLGSYQPVNHDAFSLAGDPTDSLTWSGEFAADGSGASLSYQIFDAVEAPLTPAIRQQMGVPGLRGGQVLLTLSTTLGTAYVLGIWVGNGSDWAVIPVGAFTNQTLAASMYQDVFERFNCETCVWYTCMDETAAAEWTTFNIQWRAARDEYIGDNVVGTFVCGVGAGLTCFTPVVLIPVIGQGACLGTAGCALGSAACLVRDVISDVTRSRGYRDCLCEQSRQREAHQAVGTCTRPPVPSCLGL